MYAIWTTHYPKFFKKKAEYLLCGSCVQPKKQFKVQIIGILEEIDPPSFRHGNHALIWKYALCIMHYVKLKLLKMLELKFLVARKPIAVKMTAGCLPVEPVLGLRPGWRPKASSSFLPS